MDIKLIKSIDLEPCSKGQFIWMLNVADNELVKDFYVIVNTNLPVSDEWVDSQVVSSSIKKQLSKMLHHEEIEFYFQSYNSDTIDLIITPNSILQFCSFNGEFKNMVVKTLDDRNQISMQYSNGIKHGFYNYIVEGRSALELKFNNGFVVEDLYTYKDIRRNKLIEGTLSKNYQPLKLEDIIHDFEYEHHSYKIGEWYYFNK